jgi:uncharacterized protein (DUF1330 family)
MKVENSVYPNEEQLAGFGQAGPDGPIDMINLLKFRDKAEYKDGRDSQLTGRQAYQLYADAVSELLPQFGGGMMFIADVERLMLGEVEELWDAVAIARYPSRQAMMEMMSCEAMQEIGQHRAAGLKGQLNLETKDAKGLWLAG